MVANAVRQTQISLIEKAAALTSNYRRQLPSCRCFGHQTHSFIPSTITITHSIIVVV